MIYGVFSHKFFFVFFCLLKQQREGSREERENKPCHTNYSLTCLHEKILKKKNFLA
jgi:hypothetical protein